MAENAVSTQTGSPDPNAGKAGIGAHISLLFAIIFFSGLCATSQWWGIFDFTTLNGSFGKVVANVTQNADGLHTVMSNFRGKGGVGAIDGFMFALTLIPTVMFALAMIAIFEHYGALRSARQLLSPILRPLLGLPGSCTLALIASLQSTDGGAALTRQLKDAGEIDEKETNIFATFQMTADATITNFFGSGSVLFTTVLAADGTSAVPVSMGACIGLMLIMKVIAANMMRLYLLRRGKK
jgi:nucleoside recognition membrane protein YjiH